jgi:redox-regulated HSP33 family molecular chaperone
LKVLNPAIANAKKGGAKKKFASGGTLSVLESLNPAIANAKKGGAKKKFASGGTLSVSLNTAEARIKYLEGLLDGAGIKYDNDEENTNPFEVISLMHTKSKCKCSAKKVFRSVCLLSKEEIATILKEQGQIEASCHTCSTVYKMSEVEIKKKFYEGTCKL